MLLLINPISYSVAINNKHYIEMFSAGNTSAKEQNVIGSGNICQKRRREHRIRTELIY